VANSDPADRTPDKDPDCTAAGAAQLLQRAALRLAHAPQAEDRQLASRNRRMASRTTSLILRLSWSAMR
jgi:hypothetical protein